MILELIRGGKVIDYMALISGFPPRYSKTLQPLKTIGDFFDKWHDHRNGMMPEFDEIRVYKGENE